MLIDQLLEFYYKYDKFQSSHLSEEKARKIYSYLLAKDCIHHYSNNNALLGYGESLRIDYDTFGKIICGYNVYDMLETINITNGPIAYLANVTIHPEHRGTTVLRYLRNDFLIKNFSCEYFVGHALRKRHQPVKVFKRSEVAKKWIREV